MFRKRTLFILGAGASREFDLPLGPVLGARIAETTDVRFERGSRDIVQTDGSDLFAAVANNASKEQNEYLKAFRHIQHGVQLAWSIDDFLDVHANDTRIQRVGKMAIVKCILQAEKDSKLYLDKSDIYNRLSIGKFESTWLVKLMRMLVRGLPSGRREEIFNDIAFIVFNYDRCLEHFLVHALQQFYSIDENEANSIFNKLTIIHPYGVAAPFKTTNGGQGLYFGAEGHGFTPKYWELSEGVRTYTERITDEDELRKIHKQMELAERIVFLGFGFHDQNIELLRPPKGLGLKQIFATAKGMSASDVALVTAQLQHFYTTNMQMVVGAGGTITVRPDLTCSELFDAYNKSLPA